MEATIQPIISLDDSFKIFEFSQIRLGRARSDTPTNHLPPLSPCSVSPSLSKLSVKEPVQSIHFCLRNNFAKGILLKQQRAMACLRKLWALRLVILVVVGIIGKGVDGAVSLKSMRKIMKINHEGPYLGLVVPNAFEMSPLLQSPSFIAHPKHPFIDIGGRRFRIGEVENVKIIMVMSGLGMLNSGLATELLLTLFKVKGVLHFGIAGNANPNLQIGDVVIPQFWAHTGLWSWQRYGDGPGDELALESSGDYTRKIGYLDISNYDTDTKNKTESLLNNVWYQPEEVFPVNGVSEVRQHAFWLPVNDHYYSVAKNLESMTLAGCINSTCLQRKPMVVRVERGGSANIFVDNAAYREFLNTKFNITPIDMETAAVALVCHQQRTPFIVIRALSDLAGGGSDQSNEAGVFAPLAAQNAVDAVLRFIALLY